MATLPENGSSYNYANERSYKTNWKLETRNQKSDSPLGQSHSGDKNLLVANRGQLTTYQVMLLDTPEVIRKICTTLNLVSLTEVRSPEVSHSYE